MEANEEGSCGGMIIISVKPELLLLEETDYLYNYFGAGNVLWFISIYSFPSISK